ncbi:hypothetical protein LIS04_154 [Listeria phage LIS04]|nr:hypothetical protein LIS04_154 [Listeria phage LIS04]
MKLTNNSSSEGRTNSRFSLSNKSVPNSSKAGSSNSSNEVRRYWTYKGVMEETEYSYDVGESIVYNSTERLWCTKVSRINEYTILYTFEDESMIRDREVSKLKEHNSNLIKELSTLQAKIDTLESRIKDYESQLSDYMSKDHYFNN